MSIAHFAVTRRVSVAMLATAIIVLGIFALPRLPVALMPSFQPPIVSVSMTYGNVSPETMESTITRPLENAVSRVAGIDYIQSNSFQGQSTIRAQFKYGTNIDIAAVQIQQQIARIQGSLPNDPNLSQPIIQKADPNSLPVVIVYVSDTMRTTRDLSDLYTNYLNDEFSAISGVGSASVSGTALRALMVETDANALAGYGLDTSNLINKIKAENVDLPAGIIQMGRNEFGIRANSLYQSPEQIANTVISIKNGAPIYVRDVAKVSDSIQEQRVFGRLNGTQAIRLFITAQPDANIVAVANGVYGKIDELKRRYPTMQFGVVLDQRGFIQDAITALEHTAIYGAVLAILIILLFLHSWRSTLIVAVSLPVSVLGTLFACYVFNLSLNTMTLGGLALAVGLIVDDAVVVIENIFRHMDNGEAPAEASQNATTQILTAVLASTITVVTVFVPLLLIPGLQGLIFGPMALVVMTAVAISFVVAVTTVPMLSSVFLKPEAHAESRNPYARFSAGFDRFYERFANWYRGVLAWSIDRPAIVLGTGVALFILTLLAVRMGAVVTETFPASESRFVRFDVRLPNGTALNITDRAARLVEAAFRRDPRVVDVGATIGSSFGGGGSRTLSNVASLSVTLRPSLTGSAAGDFVTEWQSRLGGMNRRPSAGRAGPTRADFMKLPPEERARRIALRQALIGAQVFGRTIDIVQQQISQGSDALEIQIYGPDYSQLYRVATSLLPAISQIPGVTRPDTNVSPPQPELDIKIDRRRAAQLGFTTSDIANDISTATSGTTASFYQVNGIQYPIIVELPMQQRRSYASIASLQLTPPTSSGSSASNTNGSTTGASSANTNTANMPGATSSSYGSLPLTAVAAVSVGVGPAQIARQNKQRRIDIDAPVIGRPLGAVVADATDAMNAARLPQGYRWQWGPAITNNNNTFSALGLVVVLAIALIYMLLAAQFESFIDPLVIMMSVPLATTGIVASLMITHRAFGLTAFIGTLMLVGIAVKNAILVVEFTKQLRHSGMTPREALLHAGPMRLRPIMMTTLATLGGMLPLALAIETGSSTNAPLGTVVIGGLITSSILSLLIVPTLYLWSSKHVEPRFTVKPPKLGRRPEPAHEPAAPREDATQPSREPVPATLKTNPQST